MRPYQAEEEPDDVNGTVKTDPATVKMSSGTLNATPNRFPVEECNGIETPTVSTSIRAPCNVSASISSASHLL